MGDGTYGKYVNVCNTRTTTVTNYIVRYRSCIAIFLQNRSLYRSLGISSIAHHYKIGTHKIGTKLLILGSYLFSMNFMQPGNHTSVESPS